MSMHRSVLLVLALVSATFPFRAAAQEETAIPKELIQYVKDAQKAGLKTAQIRQNAVKAGWPEITVDEAIESMAPKPSGVPEDFAKVAASKEASAATTPDDPRAASLPAQPSETTASKEPETEVPGTKPVNTPNSTDAGIDRPRTKPAAEAVRGDEYEIGEGDVLAVSVYGEPTASVQSATVRPDGKVSLPIIKDVRVAGSTPAQVEAMIQEQLSKVIREPDVTVIVSQINSKKIFLTGAVKREGPLKYTYRMTVLQAISEAGGLTDYAKRKNIYILHIENGRTFKLPFNYNAVLKGEHMEQNILLSPGDTIVVP